MKKIERKISDSEKGEIVLDQVKYSHKEKNEKHTLAGQNKQWVAFVDNDLKLPCL